MVFYFTMEKSDKFAKPLTCKGLRLKKDYAVPAVCYPSVYHSARMMILNEGFIEVMKTSLIDITSYIMTTSA